MPPPHENPITAAQAWENYRYHMRQYRRWKRVAWIMGGLTVLQIAFWVWRVTP